MQFFWFGAILLCAALLPVFLAENWCRRHKVKKIFPVPRGMGWLQRTAVWLVFGGHRRKTLSGDEKGEVYQAACDSKDDGWVWRHAGNPGIYDDLWSFESDAGIKR